MALKSSMYTYISPFVTQHFVIQSAVTESKGYLHSKTAGFSQNCCRILLCCRVGQLTAHLATHRKVLRDEWTSDLTPTVWWSQVDTHTGKTDLWADLQPVYHHGKLTKCSHVVIECSGFQIGVGQAHTLHWSCSIPFPSFTWTPGLVLTRQSLSRLTRCFWLPQHRMSQALHWDLIALCTEAHRYSQIYHIRTQMKTSCSSVLSQTVREHSHHFVSSDFTEGLCTKPQEEIHCLESVDVSQNTFLIPYRILNKYLQASCFEVYYGFDIFLS